jgi:hypothetical protein
MIALGFAGSRYIVSSSIFFFLCRGAALLRPAWQPWLKNGIFGQFQFCSSAEN